MSDKYDLALKQYYGHNNLKPLQKQIIKNIIEEKKDILAVLATGYGKSICYQLPFHIMNKSIIIVSPLIALMEDQRYNLEQNDIPVICINSNMSTSIKEYEKKQLLQGDHKIVYMTPESIINCEDFIVELWLTNNLGFIAIDEAHCVSSWGSDFRPDYKALSCLKEWIPELNIMALTATATPKVRLDIINTLKMKKCSQVISSFDRPNLYIEVKTKTLDIKYDLKPLVDQFKDKYCICYVRTREMTETVVKALSILKIKAQGYHAGLGAKERQQIQQDFIQGKYKWIVATVAFGMGIDQNINLVIHYGSPGDLESYYQEIGRAGRDASASTCILFYDKDDMKLNRFFLKDIKQEDFKKYRGEQIRSMEKYLKSDTCRRKTILEYFGETVSNTCCINCDNCLRKKDDTNHIQNNIQYPIYLILKFLVESKMNCGIGKISSVLMGKKDCKVKDYYSSPFYGLGCDYNLEFWKKLISICVHNDLLKEEAISSGFGTVIKTTSNTVLWYNKIKLIITNKKIKSDDYEKIIFIIDELKEYYKIPRDCLDISANIKTRKITGFEELFNSMTL